jgi:predicted nucleic acid-binding protein
MYDSLYIALAEYHKAELWTADKRLINGAKQHGFTRIYLIGDILE